MSSYNKIPKLHISVLELWGSPMIISGLIYSIVPTKELVSASEESSYFESPKSAN